MSAEKPAARDLRDQEGSLPSLLSKGRSRRGGVSLLSYLSHPLHGAGEPHSSSLTRAHSFESKTRGDAQLSLREEEEEPRLKAAVSRAPSSNHAAMTASIGTLPRSSTPDILRKNPAGEPDPDPVTPSAEQQSSAALQPPSTEPAPGLSRMGLSGPQHRAHALRLGALMSELERKLQRSSEKELRVLENQIHHLGTILKNDLSLLRSSSSEDTLAVEEVLGSFDFLSHDLAADDDTSCLGSLRLKDSGISSFQQGTLRSLGLLSEDSQSASEEDLAIYPLTSGNSGLDQALEVHLDICCILLQMIKATDFSPSQRELLEEVSNQAEVLDRVGRLLLEKNEPITAQDLFPKGQRSKATLLFWEECVNNSSSPFCCHSDHFAGTLKKRYTHKVKAKEPGQSDKVFSRLLQQVQSPCRLLCARWPLCRPDRVSAFQLSVYMKRWSFQNLGEHISRLSKEEHVLSALTGPKRRRALHKLRGRTISELLPLGVTLQTIAALLVDSNHKVCKAASSCLCRAAGCSSFRRKALLFYTESLKQPDAAVQRGSCLALKCLKASESVDHIAALWTSMDEDVQSAAREAVLSFGKKGYEAFHRMERLLEDMQDEAFKNQETEITIL